MDKYKIVEKRNQHAVHGYFISYETALKHLVETIPVYVSKGYFMDKTLKQEDFVIVPTKRGN